MKKVYVFGVAIAALFLNSCKDEDTQKGVNENVSMGVAVSIDSKVSSTRSLVTGASFASATKIGVFVTGTGYTPANTIYTGSGSSAWALDGGSTNIFLSGNNATVYGYYPSTLAPSAVQMAAKEASIAVASSISTTDGKAFNVSNNAQEDYLYAISGEASATTQATVSKATPTASLKLKHALSEITFVVKKSANFGGAGKLTNITLTKSGNKFNTGTGAMSLVDGVLGTLDAPSATLSYTDATTGVLINESTASAVTATALVPPTTVSSDGTITGSSLIGLSMTIDGFTYSASAALPVSAVAKWEPGKNYTYTITVAGGTFSISSVAIEDWVSGGSVAAVIE